MQQYPHVGLQAQLQRHSNSIRTNESSRGAVFEGRHIL